MGEVTPEVLAAQKRAGPSSRPLKILIVRPDRLGDVVLSTPVFEVVKRHYPRAHVTVMVRPGVAPVIQGLSSIDDVMIYDSDGRHAGFSGFFRLLRAIRKQDFRIAVVLQSQARLALALFLARIRYRVGPISKPHSFLFYNRGIRQRRSQVEMHETDYNLQLLRRLGIRVGTRNVATRIQVSEEARAEARAWLESKGWKSGETLVVVHPGMGGSALNWPVSHYEELIRALLREGRKVVVTAGPSEGEILKNFGGALGPLKEKAIFYGGEGVGPVDRLAAVLSFSDLVIAPSTGPLHLAVALGKRVVTFYPPIRVQSAVRWGPYIGDEDRATILVPENYCGEDFECRGNICNYYPCMKSLTVTQALQEANRQLSKSREEKAEVKWK